MEETGIIFDISHYMLEDGPGIRTNVFMKGCPLACQWCSNVYGLSGQIQTSYDRARCAGCGACVANCPNGALSMQTPSEESHGAQPIVAKRFDLCSNCGKCAEVCPTRAHKLIGRRYTVEQVVQEVEKDRMFYRRGDGGVTMSGGEILMQPGFVAAVLQQCCDAGINTAIESSAFGRWEDLSRILTWCDTVFLDCKCMDPKRHQELTGVPNTRILQNIRQAAEQCSRQGTELIIRLPLIPGKNDDEDNLIATGAFVNSLEGKPLLNILPYHNFGVGKYEYLGKIYGLEELQPQNKADLDRVAQILTKQQIRFSIGGYNI